MSQFAPDKTNVYDSFNVFSFYHQNDFFQIFLLRKFLTNLTFWYDWLHSWSWLIGQKKRKHGGKWQPFSLTLDNSNFVSSLTLNQTKTYSITLVSICLFSFLSFSKPPFLGLSSFLSFEGQNCYETHSHTPSIKNGR